MSEAARETRDVTASGSTDPAPVGVVRRLLTSFVAGVVIGAIAVEVWHTIDALLLGWVVTTALFVGRCWWAVWPLDAQRTQALATREDPGRAVTDVLLLWIAAVSVVSIVLVMFGSSSRSPLRMVLGILSLAGSWLVVHTVHLLRYARLYYRPPIGGVDFNQDEPPAYRDFAYLSMTVGTTFQVSDTNISDSAIRATILRHGIMSFVYSTVAIATTINVLGQLGSSSGG